MFEVERVSQVDQEVNPGYDCETGGKQVGGRKTDYQENHCCSDCYLNWQLAGCDRAVLFDRVLAVGFKSLTSLIR